MNKIDLNNSFFSSLNKKQLSGDKDLPTRPSYMTNFESKFNPSPRRQDKYESIAGRYKKPALEKPIQPSPLPTHR